MKGEGSFGKVYKARDKMTNQVVAIKHIENIFKHNYHAKKVARELALMIQLANEENIFSAKLLDVVIPGVTTQ